MKLDVNMEDESSALVVVPVAMLHEMLISTVKSVSELQTPILFISLNKPQTVIAKDFAKANIPQDKIFFIDCIAKSLGSVAPQNNVIHIEHASDLTSLTIAVSEFLEKIPSKKVIMIDALATLLIYNPEELLLKFVKSVVEMASESKLVFFTPSAKGTAFIEKLGVYFDNVINVEDQKV